VSTYDSIAWLPLCAGLTILGLVLTAYVARRRGWRAMTRGAAWSLLPLAAYLTGSVEMFWKIGTAIGDFAAAFAFSPEKWVGVGVAGLAAGLFLTGGGRARRKAARERAATRATERSRKKDAADGSTVPGGLPAVASAKPAVPAKSTVSAKPAVPAKPAKPAASGDDMKDIEEILRNRGL
jgi:hypothetical protein